MLTCCCYSQDIITGDEIISDSYNLKEIDGTVYEADCKKITVGGENIGQSSYPRALEKDIAARRHQLRQQKVKRVSKEPTWAGV